MAITTTHARLCCPIQITNMKFVDRFSNILFPRFLSICFLCCVLLLPSINGQNTNNEFDSIDKKSGARPFITNTNDNRGEARRFSAQINSELDKRAGGRGFAGLIDSDFDKRTGDRGFAAQLDFDKRAGGRGFLAPIEADFDKHAVSHEFIFPTDKSDDIMEEIERRGGARAFFMPFDKRSGARPFIAFPEAWKRGGGRSFSNFFQSGSIKRGGARVFQARMDKRGGGRGFWIVGDDDSYEKRGGGRSFYGHGNIAMSNFYGGGGAAYPSYDSQLKRGGARAFGVPSVWSQPWYAKKRAGGRTFLIEDMDDLKEKRMIDEMSR